ncbi:Metallo-dependent phosphatase [Hysterangium stoloniferum]|nr:Metallo-dependent phosphatase [Hysterangium stoloniferum]
MLNYQFFDDYNIDDPPSHPGRGWTRFVCISDTHSRIFQVPPGDVLLHAGDLSSWGNVSTLRKTMNWIMTLPHATKILIAGNHDHCLDETNEYHTKKDKQIALDLMRGPAAQKAGIIYLEHEAAEFIAQGRRWKVYGSPATPVYALGAFQYDGSSSAEAKEIYDRIPMDIDILLTHGPPYGVHDVTSRGKHAGCKYMSDKLSELDMARCRLHVWGHIHEARGVSINKERVQVNAAIAHHGRPIIVDLRNGNSPQNNSLLHELVENMSLN